VGDEKTPQNERTDSPSQKYSLIAGKKWSDKERGGLGQWGQIGFFKKGEKKGNLPHGPRFFYKGKGGKGVTKIRMGEKEKEGWRISPRENQY